MFQFPAIFFSCTRLLLFMRFPFHHYGFVLASVYLIGPACLLYCLWDTYHITSLKVLFCNFLAEGIPSIGMSPFSCGWSTSKRNVYALTLESLIAPFLLLLSLLIFQTWKRYLMIYIISLNSFVSADCASWFICCGQGRWLWLCTCKFVS